MCINVDEYVSGNRDKADEFHESDYEMNDENNGVEKNPQRVDATKGEEVPGCNDSSSDDYSEEDMVYSGDDFDSGVESNEEEIEKFPTSDPFDKYKPTFEIGIIYAKCLGKGCDWRINVLRVKGENTFQVREYQPKQKCARTYHVKNANSRWISGKYKGLFRTDPKRSMKGFRKYVVKEITCKVSRYQAYRAKQKALRNIEGKAEDQYKLLWDYAQKLRISNPGSTVILVMEDEVDEDGVDNSILEAREKPVITMLEWIRGSRYIVNLHTSSCSCRRWDLSGIPCKHGMSALGAEKTKLIARKRTISEVSEAVPPQPQVQPTSSDTAPISTPIVMMPTLGHNFLPQSTQHRHSPLSGVSVLLKGEKKFSTMTNLSQVVAAVGKQKGSKDAMTDKKKKT
ncbi:hypothetical protein BUALT_BualtUnG0048800 [Buddleja alternifolia]|uniref:SWIM-type domain-containing protein n=1 Tax=Buddleja alternifolia TaxID=168488 RepID=A0AAV6W338_9LAMI|nr:hypothetical protein BUALT_BualtUnG0048800 [Buddleja alternifolia]